MPMHGGVLAEIVRNVDENVFAFIDPQGWGEVGTIHSPSGDWTGCSKVRLACLEVEVETSRGGFKARGGFRWNIQRLTKRTTHSVARPQKKHS